MVVEESCERREFIGICFFVYCFILLVVLKCEVCLVIVFLNIILGVFFGFINYVEDCKIGFFSMCWSYLDWEFF